MGTVIASETIATKKMIALEFFQPGMMCVLADFTGCAGVAESTDKTVVPWFRGSTRSGEERHWSTMKRRVEARENPRWCESLLKADIGASYFGLLDRGSGVEVAVRDDSECLLDSGLRNLPT